MIEYVVYSNVTLSNITTILGLLRINFNVVNRGGTWSIYVATTALNPLKDEIINIYHMEITQANSPDRSWRWRISDDEMWQGGYRTYQEAFDAMQTELRRQGL